MAHSAKLKIGGDCMRPRDAWLLEKLGEMKAQRKAGVFGGRLKPNKERLDRFKKNGLATRLEIIKEVVA
jgi:hypothetical protein